MKKYANLKDLTNQFLHGSLSKLKMEYDNPNSTVVDIVYEDEHHYQFDYRMEVSNDSGKIKFLDHHCEYATDTIDLKRDKTFELAVSKYLFGS